MGSGTSHSNGGEIAQLCWVFGLKKMGSWGAWEAVVVTMASWLLHGEHPWLVLGLAQTWEVRGGAGFFIGFVSVWGYDIDIEAPRTNVLMSSWISSVAIELRLSFMERYGQE